MSSFELSLKIMITAENVKALIDAIKALIVADTADKTALAAAQAANAALTTQVAEFQDPALQQSVTDALAAAAAAITPPAPAPASVTSP